MFKKISIRVLRESYIELKMYVASREMTLQDFVNKAIKEKIERDVYGNKERQDKK